MTELEPLKQVKRNRSDFQYRVWSPDEKLYWRWEQSFLKHSGIEYTEGSILARYPPKDLSEKILYGYWNTAEDCLIPQSFTCMKCELSMIHEGKVFWRRCKPCMKQRNAFRKSRKWAKLVKERWSTLREIQPKKYKTLKFITLTIKNLETPGGQQLDQQQIKQAVLKPFRKYLKKAIARGWIVGGIYCYEYTSKKTEQRGIDGERIIATTPGDENYDGRGDSTFITSHHPHMHIITIGKRVDQEEHLSLWRSEVEKCQGTPEAGVHIKAIDDTRKSLWYVTEYIKKSSLGGRNREPFGILRGGS